MRARIYQPARTAMSSGTAKTRVWLLEFSPAEARRVDPLMGWQVQLPNKRKPNVRPGGYGENFATGRRGAWTH